jgi:hypothetical protein
MTDQVHLSTRLLVKTAARLHTIILKEIGNGIRISGSDSVVELLEPFTRDVFGGDSWFRRLFRCLFDRGVCQFAGPEILLEDGGHCSESFRECQVGRRVDGGGESARPSGELEIRGNPEARRSLAPSKLGTRKVSFIVSPLHPHSDMTFLQRTQKCVLTVSIGKDYICSPSAVPKRRVLGI